MSKLKLCDAIWVGVLDLDSERVQGITQPRICEYNNARLLVRLHGAAVGYVSLAVRPEETFELALAPTRLIRCLTRFDGTGNVMRYQASSTAARIGQCDWHVRCGIRTTGEKV